MRKKAIDPFTKQRLIKCVSEFRQKNGILPSLRDLAENNFSEDLIKVALKEEILEEFYVTLTNGQTIKAYKTK